MQYKLSDWLPTTVKEVEALGWDYLDVILFTGDAYVDHPSFGTAVVGRMLQAAGYRVAVVPQPNWRDDLRDFRKLGAPRLFFGVNAGSMDSMVNHYTAAKRLRSDDAYTPGGKAGFRPDYAVTVYTKILKQLFPNVPVVIGGIEASLRRFSHYDYWSDTVKPSILIESGADLLLYGMAEKVVPELAETIRNGFNLKRLRNLRQVAFVADKNYVEKLDRDKLCVLHGHEKAATDPGKFGEDFVKIETESNLLEPTKTVLEPVAGKFVVVNPPYTVSQEDLDQTYKLPFTRLPHPRYNGKGDIPAYEMIKNSVNIHRGCFGGCSFCTISAHQGKFVVSRSEKSITNEIEKIKSLPGFKGVLSDLGGPSANMYGMSGKEIELCRKCRRPSCVFPSVCRNLDNSHSRLMQLYGSVRKMPGIKKVYVGSGVRYDIIPENQRREYLTAVVKNHTSGRFKVAPEHTEDHVLKLMRKPSYALFDRLAADFERICQDNSLRYQIVPYFISSHPGCAEQDMRSLAGKCGKGRVHVEQVQDFTPTPMTLSSVMFHTGVDPYTGKKVFVARAVEEKRKQKGYFFRQPAKDGKKK